MREFDFSPFSRSSVGFDRMFQALETALTGPQAQADWPPYNIRQTGQGAFRIELAVPGFAPEEISITAQQNVLTVSGKKAGQADGYLYRGIAGDTFERRFSLADFIKVTGADVANGLLLIDLVREVPEEMKPRRIEVGRNRAQQQIEGEAAAA
ncbi:MAG: Hsp20 family protein [Acetobacteraceae bacterium]|nr:Hsp20 family protein [Acetobacteraceae bacterium]